MAAHASLRADIYGDEFFAALDGVTNALDNVIARAAFPFSLLST